jgi:hypothetical protein
MGRPGAMVRDSTTRPCPSTSSTTLAVADAETNSNAVPRSTNRSADAGPVSPTPTPELPFTSTSLRPHRLYRAFWPVAAFLVYSNTLTTWFQDR